MKIGGFLAALPFSCGFHADFRPEHPKFRIEISPVVFRKYYCSQKRTFAKPGHPTENGAMEAINGWIKEELFIDFNINKSGNIYEEIDRYIHYFNYERPSCVLNYLTPMQYKEKYWLNTL